MVKKSEIEHQKKFMTDVKLSVTKYRDRIGCDICKKDTATEGFIGFCGNPLWICDNCFKDITHNDANAKTSESQGGKNGN